MVIGLAGLIDRLAGDVCGLLNLAANLVDRRRHLFGCGRHRLNIGGCLFRCPCHVVVNSCARAAVVVSVPAEPSSWLEAVDTVSMIFPTAASKSAASRFMS